MIEILGIQVNGKAIALSLIHNAIEIATMVVWLNLVLDHQNVAGFIVLAIGLTVEHIFALAAGKIA